MVLRRRGARLLRGRRARHRLCRPLLPTPAGRLRHVDGPAGRARGIPPGLRRRGGLLRRRAAGGARPEGRQTPADSGERQIFIRTIFIVAIGSMRAFQSSFPVPFGGFLVFIIVRGE